MKDQHKKYPCVYHDNGKCQKFSDDTYNAWCVNGPCEHQVMTNADHIRSMTDEELAGWLVPKTVHQESAWSAPSYLNFQTEIDDTRESAIRGTIAWLKQPYKEDT